MIRLLLYAEVDLNLIDGSSIWLASLAELLSGAEDVEVSVLQRTAIQRNIVIQGVIGASNVVFHDPWELAQRDNLYKKVMDKCRAPRLDPATAASIIAALDHDHDFDVVIIRSIETVLALLETDPYIASRLWSYVTDPLRHTSKEEQAKLRKIFKACGRFLCQTENALTVFKKILSIEDSDKFTLLPPMIQEVNEKKHRQLDLTTPRLGYSGKFSPPYLILEMLDAFEEIRNHLPDAEFHVVGDKFHNYPPVPEFEETVKKRLQITPGVVWHGGVSRNEANRILGTVHVASSWRDRSFDSSVEMSTKILEYSALGIPVLMNPASVQYGIFGPDYPAYVESKAEFVKKFVELISSPEFFYNVSRQVQEKALEFTFDTIRAKILPLIRHRAKGRKSYIPTKIFFVGHNFKFLIPIIDHYRSSSDYSVNEHIYKGHKICDTNSCRTLSSNADIIFCEWCLGNAEWFSHNKKNGQKLIIRLHAQEIKQDLPFVDRINWNNVDRIIFICPNNQTLFLKKFPFMEDRSELIYNCIDCDIFNLPKLYGAEFNLGLLGASPKLKAPHLAFEILKKLKQVDQRYTLFIKGKHPWEYDWLWNRPLEREYYENFYQSVRNSNIANSVIFDPFGSDINAWFTKIGFMLSTSEHEGSHQAVAEGMAGGSIPIIRNWQGADKLYPSEYIFDDVDQAVDLIKQLNTEKHYLSNQKAVQTYARIHFEKEIICDKYDRLFASLMKSKQH